MNPSRENKIASAICHLGFLTRETMEKIQAQRRALSPSEKSSLPRYLIEKGHLSELQIKRVFQILQRGYFYCPQCQRSFARPSPQISRAPCPQCKEKLSLLPPKDSSATQATPATHHRSSGPSGNLTSSDVATGVQLPGQEDIRETSISSLPESLSRQLPGDYKVTGVLGRGGHGVVYEVQDPLTTRRMALKVLSGNSARDIRTRKRFEREIQITSLLEHPNIIPLYESGYLDDGSLYYTMKELGGGNLKDLIRRRVPNQSELDELLDIFLKVCEAVDYAHSQGVIHRDLKPANIAVGDFGEVIVMDWGIALGEDLDDPQVKKEKKSIDSLLAKIEDLGENLTLQGNLMGTPGYMAPEQIREEKVDSRSDVFALGAILYKILTGETPFRGNLNNRITSTLLKDPLPPSQSGTFFISPELSAISMKCLAKEPEDRYQSVGELKEDILSFRRGYGVSAQKDSLFKKGWRLVKRNKGMASAIAAVILAVGISLFFYHMQSQWEREKKLEKYWNQVAEIEEKIDLQKKEYNLDSSGQEGFKGVKSQDQRESILRLLTRARSLIERGLELEPKNKQLRKKLWNIEKKIGHLALQGENYLLSQTSFERGRGLGYLEEAEKLLASVEERRGARKREELDRIEEIISTMGKSPPRPGMIDEYVTEISRMEGSHVVKKLVPFLDHENEWVRKVVIEALGKMGEAQVKVKGKEVVVWLMERLERVDIQKGRDEAVALIWALGRMRDPRASSLVYKKRLQSGQGSSFWFSTEIPYRWIPGEKEEGQILSADKYSQRGNEEALKGNYQQALEYFNRAIKINPNKGEYYYKRANQYASLGEEEKALQDFERALRRGAVKHRVYLGRGQLFLNQGKVERALRDFNWILERGKYPIKARNNRGIAYSKKGDYKKALQDFNWILKRKENNISALINRGNLYLAREKYEAALADYQKALQINPGREETLGSMAKIKERMNRFDQALDFYNRALKINPRHPVLYCNRASLYLKMGNEKRAIADSKQALKLAPKSYLPYSNLAIIYFKRGDSKRGEKYFRKALSLAPKNRELRKNWINFLRKEKRFEEAIRQCRRFISLWPQSGTGYSLLGLIYRNQKKLQKALKAYNKALEIDPQDFGTMGDRGGLLMQMGRAREALIDYNQALKLNPHHPTLLYNRAYLLTRFKKYNRALKDYNKALKNHPRFVEAYLNRGNLFLAAKKYNRALKDYNKALQVNPHRSIIYLSRGQAWLKMDELEKALADFHRYLEKESPNEKVLLLRGKAFYQQKKLDQAREDFQKAKKINPNYHPIYLALGILYHDQKNYKKAYENLKIYLKLYPQSPQKGEIQKRLRHYEKLLEKKSD